MTKYWDINAILPYNRCFNFVNGERSIGKSYTTQKFLIKKAIEKNIEFVYIVRRQDEKKQGIFKTAFEKVIDREFKQYEFDCDSETMHLVEENGEKRAIGYCIAISECVKIKKRSFPNVKYIMFDEYMLEEKQSTGYVNGWSEPDAFLSIYHTIDREEDRVICFLLGNNTSFYNPYHLHPAFNIPKIEKGGLWYSENVLFQWAVSTGELKQEKSRSKFLKMLQGSDYGTYAAGGDYIDDSDNCIQERTQHAQFMFNIIVLKKYYGIWHDSQYGITFVSEKFDPSCKYNFAFDICDHTENTTLAKRNNSSLLNWLARAFKRGDVRYENMTVKKICLPEIMKLA